MLSQISLSIDPEMQETVLALSTDEKLLFPQDNPQKIRLKRQVPQSISDCKQREEECQIVLNGMYIIFLNFNKIHFNDNNISLQAFEASANR